MLPVLKCYVTLLYARCLYRNTKDARYINSRYWEFIFPAIYYYSSYRADNKINIAFIDLINTASTHLIKKVVICTLFKVGLGSTNKHRVVEVDEQQAQHAVVTLMEFNYCMWGESHSLD